jgi:hypothetical protein
MTAKRIYLAVGLLLLCAWTALAAAPTYLPILPNCTGIVMGNGSAPINCSNTAVAANNAELAALPVSVGRTARRLGFATAGDGGEELYAYSSSPCSLNGGNGDNGSQVKSNNGGCWLNDLRRPQRLRIYGARGDNSNDDTAAMNAAFAAVCSKSGGVSPWQAAGRIEPEVGVFVVSNMISIPCNGAVFRGSGNGNTASGNLDYRNTVIRIAPSFPANTTLFAYTSTTSDYGSGLDIGEFSIDATSEPASSWLFDISWVQHAKVHDISILSPTNILKEVGGAINLMENVSTLNQTGVGVDFSGDSSGCSAVFVGGIASGVLTVASMTSGTINSDNGNAARFVFLPNTPASYTTVQSQTSGTTGGVGVYQIFYNGALATTLNVNAGTTMYASDIGGCNKRADLLRLRNVSFNISGATSSGGGICINYHNFAQTLTVDHMVCESPYIGINEFCDASQGNFGQTCPAFFRCFDCQIEGAAYRDINSSDTQDEEYGGMTYLLGLGAGSGDIAAAFYNTNFQQCPTQLTPGVYTQGLRFHGGRVGNSARQNMFIAKCEFDVHDTHFFLSGLANSAYPSIEVAQNATAITGLTSVTTTATATVPTTVGLITGQQVTVSGATPSAYNGTYAIVVTSPTTFTYTFAGGTSPATGSPQIAFPTYSGLIHHNILCEVSGQQPNGLTMSGITIDSGVLNTTIDHNIGRGCNAAAHLVTDNTGQLSNVIDRNYP